MKILTIILATLMFGLCIFTAGITARDGFKFGSTFKKVETARSASTAAGSKAMGRRAAKLTDGAGVPSGSRFQFGGVLMVVVMLAAAGATATLFVRQQWSFYFALAALGCALATYLVMPHLPSGGFEAMPHKKALYAAVPAALGCIGSFLISRRARRAAA